MQNPNEIAKSQHLKNTTRGGQVILHNLRMIGQVLKKIMCWLLPLWLAVSGVWFFAFTDADLRHIGQQWFNAELKVFFFGQHHAQLFALANGQKVSTTAGQILETPFVVEARDQLFEIGLRGLGVGCWVYLIGVAGTLMWLRRCGDAYTRNNAVKGDYLGGAGEVKRLIRQQDRESDLVVGKEQLPLPHLSELQHFLLHGTTGSGKSTIIKELLDHIRRRGDRAIIYDKSCNLVSEFYRPENDRLMNPLDNRGVDWNLWRECRDKTDYENLAAALIPMPPSAQDPFWVNAARTIFAAAAFRMHKEKQPKILPLLRYLLTAEIGDLQSLLQGTEAESLMSEKTEKTAISIKSVLATYLKSLCYIKDGDQPFSIRQWVQNDNCSEWLFISSLGDKHESLKPLITAWLDIAVNALLSLPESPQRRIWVILDELGSLQQLPYLTSALSEARKFGGCFVVGIQSYAQLAKTYGHEGGKEISSLLNTRFLFRIPDPDIAKWSAYNLGETTIEEVREGISYGANTIRDGVSIQRQEREKPVVPPSEIMRLHDLTCYVRLPGAYPIAQLHTLYVTRATRQAAFIPRPFDQEGLLGEIQKIVEKQAIVVTKKTGDPADKTTRKAVNQKNTNLDIDLERDIF